MRWARPPQSMQVITGSGSYTGSTVPAERGDARLRGCTMEHFRPMRTNPFVALALTGSLLLAACGGGDEEEAATTDTSTATTTAETSTTTTVPEAGIPVSMLTGLPLPDEWVQARPVVAVKFDNVEGRSTPQVGIGAAEVVYEVPVEGQVTRFLALFQSVDASPIGPIRSARGSEIGLLEELNRPLFAWHGANGLLDSHVRASTVVPRSFDDVPHLYYRDRDPEAAVQLLRPRDRRLPGHGAGRRRPGPREPDPALRPAGEACPSPNAVPRRRSDLAFPPPFGGPRRTGHAGPLRVGRVPLGPLPGRAPPRRRRPTAARSPSTT